MPWPHLRKRHGNFYVAAAAGVVVAGITLIWSPDLFPAAAASVFSLTYLTLTAFDMPRLTPDYLRKHAGDEDAPPLVVFLLTLGVVVYVTVSLFLVVNSSPDWIRLTLGIASVVLAWLMIHAMWAMHYAWEFYEEPKEASKSRGRRQQAGGLEFPGEDEPDGMDFIYFSFVVAMTDQTSDTEITTQAMRRIVTGHSLFSYFFNTVFVAAAVNIVVQLGQS